jgi:DNA anti-recombination protein RmuC
MQSNIHGIIQLVQKFRQEYDKFSVELDTLGTRLDSASKQYQQVSSTRARSLGRVMDQIDSQKVLDTPEKNLLD